MPHYTSQIVNFNRWNHKTHPTLTVLNSNFCTRKTTFSYSVNRTPNLGNDLSDGHSILQNAFPTGQTSIASAHSPTWSGRKLWWKAQLTKWETLPYLRAQSLCRVMPWQQVISLGSPPSYHRVCNALLLTKLTHKSGWLTLILCPWEHPLIQ